MLARMCLEDATIVPEIPQLSVRPPKASKAGLQCCIFLDFHAPDQCVSCANGHHVSQAALGKYLEMELEKPLDYHQKLQGLKCPKCELCFQGEQVSSLLSPESNTQFQELRKKCADKAKYEEEVAGKDDLSAIQECIRLQFKNNKGEFVGCYMCPECGFGPIDKYACDDMQAHHFQRKGDTFIDNSCPMCHFFSHGIRSWKKWDGSFLPGHKVKQMQKIGEEINTKSAIPGLQKEYAEVDIDSEAKWAAETKEFQVHLAKRRARLAESDCRPAEEISLEMRNTSDPERLALLGREFQKSLRIINPRMDMLKFGKVPVTVEAWITHKKKLLRKDMKKELQRVNDEIHDEVLKFNAQS